MFVSTRTREMWLKTGAETKGGRGLQIERCGKEEKEEKSKTKKVYIYITNTPLNCVLPIKSGKTHTQKTIKRFSSARVYIRFYACINGNERSHTHHLLQHQQPAHKAQIYKIAHKFNYIAMINSPTKFTCDMK